MLKEFKKRREIEETLQAYGEVQQGSEHFKEVSRLRGELGIVKKEIRNTFLFWITCLLIPTAGAIGLYEAFKKRDVRYGERPVPGLVSGQSADSDVSGQVEKNEKIPDLFQIEARIKELLYRFYSRDVVEKIMEDSSNVPMDSKKIELLLKCQNKLNLISDNQSQFNLEKLFLAFRSGAVPKITAMPAEAANYLAPEQFLVDDVSNIGGTNKWFKDHQLPYFDKQNKVLYLPEDVDPIHVMIVMLDVVEIPEDQLKLLKSNVIKLAIEIWSEAIGGSHVTDFLREAEDINSPFGVDPKVNFPYLLLEFAMEVVDHYVSSGAVKRISADERNLSIERYMYFILSIMKLDNFGENSELGQIIKETLLFPESRLMVGTLDDSLYINNLRFQFQQNRIEAIEKTKGKAIGVAEASEMRDNPKFNEYLKIIMIPLARMLKLNAANDHDRQLAEYFMKNAVPAPQIGDPEDFYPGRLEAGEFYVSTLDEDEGGVTPRHKWMCERNLSYFDAQKQILYVGQPARFPIPGFPEWSDMWYIMNSMTGNKRSTGTEHDLLTAIGKVPGSAGMKEFDGPIEHLNFRVSQALKKLAMDIVQEKISAGGMNISAPNVARIKQKFAEAMAYRLLIHVVDMVSAQYSHMKLILGNEEIFQNLRDVIQNPDIWLTLTDEEMAGHELFKK